MSKTRGANGKGQSLPPCDLRSLDLADETALHCGQLLALFGTDVVLVQPGESRARRLRMAVRGEDRWIAFVV